MHESVCKPDSNVANKLDAAQKYVLLNVKITISTMKKVDKLINIFIN